MSNGIFIFIILLIAALGFVSGAGVALCYKAEESETEVVRNEKLERQWVSFLNYDGNERE